MFRYAAVLLIRAHPLLAAEPVLTPIKPDGEIALFNGKNLDDGSSLTPLLADIDLSPRPARMTP